MRRFPTFAPSATHTSPFVFLFAISDDGCLDDSFRPDLKIIEVRRKFHRFIDSARPLDWSLSQTRDEETIACDEGWFSKRSSLERRVVARDTPFWQASDFTMRSRCIQVGEGEKMFVARGRPSNAPREFRKLQLHRQSDAWRFISGVVKIGGWKGGCEEVEEDRCRGLGIVWILMCWNS